jgi:hypothetical protein
MDNGPKLWTVVATEVRKAFPTCVIAGGAVRDYVLGKEVKDIDVFVYAKDGPDMAKKVAKLIENDDWEMNDDDQAADVEYLSSAGLRRLEGVVDLTFLDEHNVQLIGVSNTEFSPDWLMQDFDIGLCRAYFQEPNLFRLTDEFARDVRDRTLTLYHGPEDPRYERSLERIERLKKKFKDFKGVTVDGKEPPPVVKEEEFDAL